MQLLRILAETVKIDPTKVNNLPVRSATDAFAAGLNIAYFAAGAVAVIVIVLAGYTFSTAVYDPAKITQAKNALLYAVVGLIVVIFAFVFTQFILGRF